MVNEFYEILMKTLGESVHDGVGMNTNQQCDHFDKWATAWEAPRGVGDSGLRGDEINVGDLWEDKSQKDFKSYL